MSSKFSEYYDYIIVGGGSAGCVLASRLSAKSTNRVLLCEAGADIPIDNVPPAILDSYPGTAYLNPDYIWRGQMASTMTVNGTPVRARKYEQARILGGGSSINGQFFNRGAPSDYDAWEEHGARGWNWQSVLPHFKNIETDIDFHDDLHGSEGPLRIRRVFPAQWPGHARAVAAAFEAQGYDYLPDQNGEFRDGYFPIAISNFNEQRESVATTYLDASVRSRPNLTIKTETEVASLSFDGTRCTGIVIQEGDTSKRLGSREVIVSCGAIGSPALLLRSGIGPVSHLRELGIDVVIDLPGVGQNLMEHPSIALASFIEDGARINDVTRHHIRVGARYSSEIGGAPSGDMLILGVTKTSWHAVGRRIGTLLNYINNPFSRRGEVTLASRDWRVRPNVALNLLDDERDLDRLVDGFKRMAVLQASASMQAVTKDPFPASYSEKVRQVAMLSIKNKIITDVLAKLLDGPAPLRSLLMRRVVAGGPTLDELLADDDALRGFIRGACVGVWHASCTCRMGSDHDPLAVTDEFARVRNIDGLRVVDASIFPIVPGANTNAPTLMVAEKIASELLLV
ncbi:GMC family oxidoreductase [Burkholderia seminalis]|uniref:GMC family oxidoreductase N-terminal domain-containing protein n=1 Tax=Burkholderia seminalis TaxID=488731 RepID=A0A8A8DF48_9BURK|nr:GMC family oxidoreductase N-terminal domain-containing protein [Burkholderia seminalis]QTO23424.1 GMC family oxidoreductase N-terminal domain-containing protein [Burkholderia seminalis]